MKKHLIGFAFFVLVVAGATYFFSSDPLESDDRMIAKFEMHRDDLERLIIMIGQDHSVKSVHRDFVLMNGSGRWYDTDQSDFTQDRLEAYKQIFARLGDLNIKGISRNNGQIVFNSTSAAIDETDDPYQKTYVGKGLLYSTQPIDSIVSSLDNTGFEITETRFRSLGGNWYLYRDSGISKPE